MVHRRAGTVGYEPEAPGDFSMRMAMLLMHPAVFAAHGYSALLAKNFEPDRCKRGLLSLAVDALTEVQASVFNAAKYYADSQPDFLWALFALGMRQCVLKDGESPDIHTVSWEPHEAERLLALLDEAKKSLASGQPLELPAIHDALDQGGRTCSQGREDTKGYGRNDLRFQYHIAGKLLLKFPYQALLADASRRKAFLVFVGQLLDYTIQKVIPPFAESRRNHQGNTPFEWVFDFSSWLGRVALI